MAEFSFNVKKLRKPELAFLMDGRCKHGHSWLEHPQCYIKEQPKGDPMKRKLGYFDIESSHLKANFGFMLSYKIWDDVEQKMYGRAITPKEINPRFIFDRDLCKELVTDLRRFTHVVVYWGKDRRHDLPFVRTRCMKHGLSFPLYGQLGVIDLYDLAKNKLSLHRYGLQSVCEELGVPAKGHPMRGPLWIKANAGHKESLDYIEVHNEEDVVCMPPVLYALEPYYRATKLSI